MVVDEKILSELRGVATSTVSIDSVLNIYTSVLAKYTGSALVKTNLFYDLKIPHATAIHYDGKLLDTREVVKFLNSDYKINWTKLINENLQPVKSICLLNELDEGDLYLPNGMKVDAELSVVMLIVSEAKVLGSIEFINAIEIKTNKAFLATLSIAAGVVAQAISSFENSNFLSTIDKINWKGFDVSHKPFDKHKFFNFVCCEIVANRYFDCCVAFIRICNANGLVEFEEYAESEKLNWTMYTSHLEFSNAGQCGNAFNDGEVKEICDITDEVASSFVNKDWILANGLKSYYCTPIQHQSERVGTLSLFFKRPYRCSKNEMGFVATVANSVAKTKALDSRLTELKKNVIETQGNYVREISKLQSVKEFAHFYKNDLRLIEDTLANVIPTLTKGRITELSKIFKHIESRRETLDDYILSSRGEVGNRQVFKIEDLIREIIDIYHSEAALAGIKVDFEYVESNLFVNMNKGRLFEAVSNIYQNAIKACAIDGHKKIKEIQVTSYVDSSMDDYCIQVSDTGIGIDKNFKDKIFEEGVSGSSKFGGTGQGLFFSKRIMDELIGDIDVISKVGEGTTVVLRFPMDGNTED